MHSAKLSMHRFQRADPEPGSGLFWDVCFCRILIFALRMHTSSVWDRDPWEPTAVQVIHLGFKLRS